MADGLEVLRGQIEDVILRGRDNVNYRPAKSYDETDDVERFTYDLYNLDFLGGLAYARGKGKPKRLLALERLFLRQRGHSFVLLLTINVRDTVGPAVAEYLRSMALPEAPDLLNWYCARHEGEYEYKLKAAVPLFLRDHAQPQNFDCTFYPVVVYEGHERARMVHFVASFRATGQILTTFSVQSPLDVLMLPMVRCVDGKLTLATLQHPGLTEASCAKSLNLLPAATRETLIR